MVSHSLAIQKFAPTLKVFAHPATSASAFISTSGLSISTGKLEIFVKGGVRGVKGGEHLGGETFLQQTRRRPRLFLRIQCWRFVAMSYLFQTDHGLEWRISQKNPNGGLRMIFTRGRMFGTVARKADTQIFWIVVLAAVFWAGIWEHDKVVSFAQRAYTVGHGMINRAGSR